MHGTGSRPLATTTVDDSIDRGTTTPIESSRLKAAPTRVWTLQRSLDEVSFLSGRCIWTGSKPLLATGHVVRQ
ncbi:hypothetical protein P8C59_006738 [Phyllachora maydis]|uniref:Uncharacterized protein n=1 Tax=Phyllachora maydis TaxID=1825666 RepID=A0AAD9I710_9PEZI|nr:hypothetical protein P8C59_006738 [Phyllachora maydis]